MTLKNHYLKMLWEIAMVCGALIPILLMFKHFEGVNSITTRTMWAMILLASTIVFRAESLINFHDLEEHKMRWNYIISSVLADVTLLVLLYHFTPGGRYFYGKAWIILICYIVFKSLFYLLMYIRVILSAKEINTLLKRRKAK